MPKNKPHQGLLKRVRITKTGKVKHAKAGFKHLRSGKPKKRLRRLRRGGILLASDTKRLSLLLFRSLRGDNQELSALRKSPTPEQRKAKRVEARKVMAAKVEEARANRNIKKK
jgi:large subunit ribosomal protein L35